MLDVVRRGGDRARSRCRVLVVRCDAAHCTGYTGGRRRSRARCGADGHSALTEEGVDAVPPREEGADLEQPLAVARDARRHLDALAARAMTEARFGELAALFGQAAKLEADFWQMGLDAPQA